MLLLLLGTCGVVATSLLLNAVLPLRGRLANLLGLACLSYAQVVLLSEILSELGAIGRIGFLAGHLVLLSLAPVLWWRRGRPHLLAFWWFSRAEVGRELRRHRLLGAFVAAVLAICVVNLGLALAASPRHITWDPLSYHLPRAYFWQQSGTARHYATEDIRQVEFPPNPSFCHLWIMVLSGGYAGLCLPSWLAGVVAAAGTTALARAAGHSRAAALFAGMLFLTLPLPITHMATEYADLPTAATGASLVFFALRALERWRDGTPWQRNHELLYGGMAFGLFVGSKFTALFMLPGAALALVAYAGLSLKRQAVAPLVALGASCVLGFALLGSYNYVLNWLDFGHPVSSTAGLDLATSDLASLSPTPELTSFRGNLARYVYQMMDWSLVGSPGNPLYRLNLWVVQAIDRALGLRMAAIPGAGWEVLSFRDGHPNRTGFGPLGYAITVASPFLLVFCLLRIRRSRRALFSGLLLVMAWGWLVAFAALAAWSLYKPHSFPVFVPMLVAGAVPWCYTGQRRATLWLLPVAVSAACIAAVVTVCGLARPQQLVALIQGGPSGLWGGGVTLAQLNLLRESFPPGSAVGFSGHRPTSFVFMEHLPQFGYVSLRREDTGRLLAEGKVAAVLLSPDMEARTDERRARGEMEVFLTGACPDAECDSISLPFLDHIHIRCLYVPDPMSFLWEQRKHYGYDLVRSGETTVLQFTDRRPLTSLEKGYDYGALTIALPTPGLVALGESPQLRIGHAGAVLPGDVTRATYNHAPVDVHLTSGEVAIDLPAGLLDRQAPLQLCVVDFGDDIAVRSWRRRAQVEPGVLAVQTIQVVARR